MNILLGIILLMICVFIGYIKANKYYLRKLFYNDFVKFNNLLKQEVSFRQGTIIDLLEKETNLNDFYIQIKGKILKKENVKNELLYLTDEEIMFFSDYIEKIGSGDKLLELNYLENVNQEIVKKQNQSNIDNEKYKKLYIKLGFFIGLILFILVL